MNKLSVVLLVFFTFLFFSCNENVNQCENILCSNHGKCRVVDNKPVCECDTGYIVNGLNCEQDIDKICAEVTCSGNGVCVVGEDGKPQCNCYDGFYSEGPECLPDSCYNIDCGEHGICQKIENSDTVTCKCDDGYYLENMKCLEDKCINVNCGEHQVCVNNESGNPECVCDTGYYRDGSTCLVDHCIDVDCGNGHCVNNGGVDYRCECDAGSVLYEGKCYTDKITCIIQNAAGENPPFEAEGNSKLKLESKSYYLTPENQAHLNYEWRVIESPEAYYKSSWLTYPSSDSQGNSNSDKHTMEFFIPYLTTDDSKYLVELKITTDNGLTESCSAEVKGITKRGLYIELLWNKNGNDLDLHLLNPEDQELDINDVDDENDSDLKAWRERVVSEWWDSTPPYQSDCYFDNCIIGNDNVEWGDSGEDDNPKLIRDDISGRGPEIIVIDNPSEAWYKISVYFYYTYNKPVIARVKVYCNGDLKYQKSNLFLDRNFTWLVNDIYWEKSDNGKGICHIFDENSLYNERQGDGLYGYQGKFVNYNCEEGYWGENCEICATGYHFYENNCVIDETCEFDTCTEVNKTRCDIVDGMAVCLCDEGYHKDENDQCVEDEVCRDDTCTEGNRTKCDIVEGIAVCSCDNHYHEDDSGNCVLDDDICGKDELEPNFWTPYRPANIHDGEYNLKLCKDNEDVFLFYLIRDSVINIDLRFNNSDGDVDMELYKETDREWRVDVSGGYYDFENIQYTADESGFYVLRIYTHGDGIQNYTMDISGVSEFTDLINKKLEPESLIGIPSQTILVNYNIKSESSLSINHEFNYKIYLSEDDVLDDSDTPIYDELFDNMGSDENIEKSVNVTLPENLNLSDYYFISKIDSENIISELDENNNIKITTFRVLGTCSPDNMENNNSIQEADLNTVVTIGRYNNLTICPGDKDYYAIDLNAGDNLYVNVFYLNIQNGDIDLKFLDSEGNILIESSNDNKHINYNIIETGRYYIKIEGKTANDKNIYDLEILKQ